MKASIANKLREIAEDINPQKEARLVEEGSSKKEKGYEKMPNEKPPRRQINNVSDTREYRRDYQENYRAENGNGYIPKPKKNKGDKKDG